MLLEINHLEKVFRTRFSKEVTRALQDVDFKVDKNEFIAIMGESGSGKTTLLNILATLEKPTKGSVILNGKEITKIKESNMQSHSKETESDSDHICKSKRSRTEREKGQQSSDRNTNLRSK